MDAITSDTITRGRTKWWIDWPPPKSTDTDEPTKSSPETSKTKKDDPKSTVMTEESTITDGMTTKTDSGRTVTVPNSEVVTITRHTTIVTDKPSPSTSVPESTINPSRPNQSGAEQTSPPPSAGASGDSGSQGGGPLPTGAIVGIGIGGAAIVVFLVITAIMIKRRVKRRREEQETGTAQHNTGRDDRFDEKQFSQQMSAHTTGTQGSGDPFAPFGG